MEGNLLGADKVVGNVQGNPLGADNVLGNVECNILGADSQNSCGAAPLTSHPAPQLNSDLTQTQLH